MPTAAGRADLHLARERQRHRGERQHQPVTAKASLKPMISAWRLTRLPSAAAGCRSPVFRMRGAFGDTPDVSPARSVSGSIYGQGPNPPVRSLLHRSTHTFLCFAGLYLAILMHE
jgi:hypothetical protein